MNQILSVARKELRSYFNSPIAYLAVVSFLVFTSVWLFYITEFVAQDVATLRGYFGIMPLVFIVLLPALTMRSWAEESKSGTAELLLTLPLRDTALVLGKFVGAVVLLLVMLLLTVFVPLTVSPLGDFGRGQVVGEYIGIFLLGLAGISIGQFVSSFSRNQISAFILSAIALLTLTLVSQVNTIVDLPTWLSAAINYVSLQHHFQSFVKGVVDTRDVIYFVVMTALFLFLNTRVLVLRKWS